MYVDNIRQSSERMREMLNTLLDFFRLDNGKEQPNLSPCRISAITHILETEFMPIAMNKGLTLIVESHTDAVVLTDKERILQIGNNLLSNAIKFTDNGSVSLAADYDNGLLKLIVEDTGTGMTEDEQQRVFGAFERLSNAAAKDGFGLGAAYCGDARWNYTLGKRERQREPLHGGNSHADSRGTAGTDNSSANAP